MWSVVWLLRDSFFFPASHHSSVSCMHRADAILGWAVPAAKHRLSRYAVYILQPSPCTHTIPTLQTSYCIIPSIFVLHAVWSTSLYFVVLAFYCFIVSWKTNTRFLLLPWRVSASALFFFLFPSFLELSLTVPIVNTLAFLFTVIGEWWVESKVISRGTFRTSGVVSSPVSCIQPFPTNTPIKTPASAWLCRCAASPCVCIAKRDNMMLLYFPQKEAASTFVKYLSEASVSGRLC